MPIAKTLIWLGKCPGWSESSLGAEVILLVLSWGSSYHDRFWCLVKMFNKVANFFLIKLGGRLLKWTRSGWGLCQSVWWTLFVSYLKPCSQLGAGNSGPSFFSAFYLQSCGFVGLMILCPAWGIFTFTPAAGFWPKQCPVQAYNLAWRGKSQCPYYSPWVGVTNGSAVGFALQQVQDGFTSKELTWVA